jgi:hypothetical protein
MKKTTHRTLAKKHTRDSADICNAQNKTVANSSYLKQGNGYGFGNWYKFQKQQFQNFRKQGNKKYHECICRVRNRKAKNIF